MQNKYTKDIQWFDVKYGIYFTSETEFLIFLEVYGTSQNILKILSHEWNKFHI